MNPYAQHARAYQKQAVMTASPAQLVLMLYDGVLRFIAQAQDAFQDPDSPRNIERIHHSLQRANAILAELQSNLDTAAGGDYAEQLDRLYDYYQRRLEEANLRKDVAPVNEVENLVRQLRDAWAEMLTQEQSAENQQPRAASY